MRTPAGHDDRLAGSGQAILTVDGEVGLTCDDGEGLFLVRMDVFGDHATGHAAPGETDQLPVAVLGDLGVLIHSPVAGLKKGRKPLMQ